MSDPPVGDPPAAYHVRVSELPEGERPRERLQQLGPQALTTAELLAILLRTGTVREGVLQVASRLLRDRQGLRGLAATDLVTLSKTHGVGAGGDGRVGQPSEGGPGRVSKPLTRRLGAARERGVQMYVGGMNEAHGLRLDHTCGRGPGPNGTKGGLISSPGAPIPESEGATPVL